EVLVAHRDNGQLEPSQSGDVIGMSAGGVNEVAAFGGPAAGLYPRCLAVGAIDLFDAGGGCKPHSNFAALMFVSLDQAARSQMAIGRTPKNGFGAGKIHLGPTPRGSRLVNQPGLQAGVISSLLQAAK